MIIIGIAGKMHSGKDTLCDIIRNECAVKTVRIAFADALKLEVARATGTTVDYINIHKPQFRTVLQWWGSDFRRKDDVDYWIKQTWQAIVNLPDDVQLVIIPDVRFKNEAEAIKKVGGLVFNIKRNTNMHSTHISECDLNDYTQYDETIDNNSTILSLTQKAHTIIDKLNLPKK
jgi:hypothetical protein